MKEFEIGDIVHLNSNPNTLMTVYSLDPFHDGTKCVKCAWFDVNGLIHYEDLDSRALTEATEE